MTTGQTIWNNNVSAKNPVMIQRFIMCNSFNAYKIRSCANVKESEYEAYKLSNKRINDSPLDTPVAQRMALSLLRIANPSGAKPRNSCLVLNSKNINKKKITKEFDV